MRRVSAFTTLVLLGCELARTREALGAESEERFVRAEVRSSDECASAKDIIDPVNRLLGRTAVLDAPGDLVVFIEPRRDGEMFGSLVRLELASGEEIGSRILTSPTRSCEEVRERVVLSVSLMIDLERKEIAEKRAAFEAAKPLEGEIVVRKGDVEPRFETRLSVRLGGIAIEGLGPEPEFGPSVALRLRVGIPWELAGFGIFEREFSTWSEGAEERFALAGAGMRLRGCPLEGAFLRGVVESELCAGVLGSYLDAEGRSFATNRIKEHFFGAPDLEVGVLVRFAKTLGLRIGVGAFVPLPRPSFAYARAEGVVVLHSALPVVFSQDLSLQGDF